MKLIPQTIMRLLDESLYQLYMATMLIRSRIRCFFTLLGKPPEFLFRIQEHDLLVRRNASDLLTIREVWSDHFYLDPPPGGMVVDIGANIGAFAVFAARHAKHVFAFEPLTDNVRILKRNTQSLRNVTVFPIAVAGSHEMRTFTFNDIMPGNASMVTKRGMHQETVQTITLTEVLDLCCIPRIHLLKMDIEGAEYELLSAAPPETLRRIDAITMEFHDFLPTHHYSSLIRILKEADFAVTCRPHRWYRLVRVGYLQARLNGDTSATLRATADSLPLPIEMYRDVRR